MFVIFILVLIISCVCNIHSGANNILFVIFILFQLEHGLSVPKGRRKKEEVIQ